jgi:hypothetical protein
MAGGVLVHAVIVSHLAGARHRWSLSDPPRPRCARLFERVRRSTLRAART